MSRSGPSGHPLLHAIWVAFSVLFVLFSLMYLCGLAIAKLTRQRGE